MQCKELLLQCLFRRYSQLVSSFCSSGSQNSSAICSSHSFSKAVLVFSLSIRRLECSFHDRISLSNCSLDSPCFGIDPKKDCKDMYHFLKYKSLPYICFISQ